MNLHPDQSAFVSRLHLAGTLTFDSALRIGASRSIAVDEPDLPVLRTADGRPYIPGSSLKGALRSHVEAVLRTLQAGSNVAEHNLACLSVGKPPARPSDDESPSLCLTQSEVSQLKEVKPSEWHSKLSPVLAARLPAHEQIMRDIAGQGERAGVDKALRELSCWCCCVFGSSWLASKVYIKDLMLDEQTFVRTEIRDGVGIDRDSGRAADGAKYQFEVVPVGTAFHLDILAQNASEAELGLLWIGIKAFEEGHILMGGAKSRGLGWCKLALDWSTCRYVTPQTLLNDLMPVESVTASVPSSLQGQPRQWVQAFFEAIGARPAGGNHA